MCDSQKALIGLIKACITGEKCGSAVIAESDSDIIVKICDLAEKHDISHMAAYALENVGMLDKADKSQMADKYFAALYASEIFDRELDGICKLFEDNNIDFVPLKGAVIRKLYPEKWMRSCGDIDILVRSTDLKRAADVLNKGGYKSNEIIKGFHDVTLKGKCDTRIELHFSLCMDIDKADDILKNVWNEVYSENGCRGFSLKNEFFVFYHISHMMHHVMRGGCGIRSFADLYLINKNFTVDKSALDEMLTNASLKKFYDICIRLCSFWFEDENADEEVLLLEKFIMEGGTFGSAVRRVQINKIRKNGYNSAKPFIKYDRLCEAYPKLEKHRCLYPFYSALRLCKIFRKGKISKLKNNIKLSITAEGADEDTTKLIEILGI